MHILYEDKEIIVVEKPAGEPVQTKKITTMDLTSKLKIYLQKKYSEDPYLGIIHRLDQPGQD